jgi:hypothetical protein
MLHAGSSLQTNNYDIMEEYFIRLTNSVYKILEFFPESDPLKNRAKDKALEIMEKPTLEDIDMLLGYLWIAKTQGWLSSSNCLIISNEYEKIRKESFVLNLTNSKTKKQLMRIFNQIQPSCIISKDGGI